MNSSNLWWKTYQKVSTKIQLTGGINTQTQNYLWITQTIVLVGNQIHNMLHNMWVHFHQKYVVYQTHLQQRSIRCCRRVWYPPIILTGSHNITLVEKRLAKLWFLHGWICIHPWHPEHALWMLAMDDHVGATYAFPTIHTLKSSSCVNYIIVYRQVIRLFV